MEKQNQIYKEKEMVKLKEIRENEENNRKVN